MTGDTTYSKYFYQFSCKLCVPNSFSLSTKLTFSLVKSFQLIIRVNRLPGAIDTLDIEECKFVTSLLGTSFNFG